MSLLSWNCRGLGNPTAIRVLADLVRSKRPQVVLLMETFVDTQRMEPIRVQLGFEGLFVVDADRHKGGLALLWSKAVDLTVMGYSNNHIDCYVSLDVGSPTWRFTGYYGYPKRQHRRSAWQFMRQLAAQSMLPWLVMGDFNDLLDQSEKRGRAPHPPWCIRGFREAVLDCGLQDLPFSGYQFTWHRSRGTPNMVEEKLDRVLCSDSWLTMFDRATASSIHFPYSDHLPLILNPTAERRETRRARFCFDNIWLREDMCCEIVSHSWERTTGLDTLTRIARCS
ncbi:PREDICTED: uncharacterized protein LOC109160652 [Ipomoea nil]|uniref:uncharacterized protein LOC109160652 n=1 Tax=Ipomoea nil TaxID=35883 RepID=UPI00090146F0|nr:PREDICTED: uncharacterized protein LOC109160652 [Ipomoea nil]